MLTVLSILSFLAAVVSVSMLGFIGMGEEEGYDVDEQVIWSAASVFYADAHCFSGTDGWNGVVCSSVHNYPTYNGRASDLYPGIAVNLDGLNVHEVWNASGNRATTAEITDAAIWMGLLVNGPGEGSPGPDIAPGDGNSPRSAEVGPYLNEVPESCSSLNHSLGKGTYTWIAGSRGVVYGASEVYGVWYIGYSGSYP